jgi:hypothetical protein
MSRPRTIHPEDCTTSRPMDCEFPIAFPPSTALIMEGESSFTPQLFYYDLACKYHWNIACGVMSTPVLAYSVVETCHQDILNLAASLPSALRDGKSGTACADLAFRSNRQRLRLLSDTEASIMALHRPHIHLHPESRMVAVECTLRLLATQDQVCQVISERHYPIYGFSFFTIDAVVFLATLHSYVIEEHADAVSDIIDALEAAETRLSMMKARSVVAESGIGLVRKCRDIYMASTSYSTSVLMTYFAPFVTPVPSWSSAPFASPCGKTATLPMIGFTG